MKLEFGGQFLEKYSNIKFYGNPSSESRLVPSRQEMDGRTDGQTDKYDKANRRFSQFCERA
jgi:hypothetical protein